MIINISAWYYVYGWIFGVVVGNNLFACLCSPQDEELIVEGPLPQEPDDAPWRKSDSGIRKLFKYLTNVISNTQLIWEVLIMWNVRGVQSGLAGEPLFALVCWLLHPRLVAQELCLPSALLSTTRGTFNLIGIFAEVVQIELVVLTPYLPPGCIFLLDMHS